MGIRSLWEWEETAFLPTRVGYKAAVYDPVDFLRLQRFRGPAAPRHPIFTPVLPEDLQPPSVRLLHYTVYMPRQSRIHPRRSDRRNIVHHPAHPPRHKRAPPRLVRLDIHLIVPPLLRRK